MIKLLRVDERLIHGQVAFAWTNSLKADCILIVNDAVAADKLRSTSLKMAAPAGVKFVVKTLKDAIPLLNGTKTDKYKLFLIVDNTSDALELVKNVKDVDHVNLGNMKLTSERTMITPSLAVSEKEKEQIHEMVAAGAEVKSGNILGAVIYFLLYTAIHFITKILGGKYGYKMGTKFLENSEENHLMDKLSMGASILGMTVIGAMIGTMVSLQTTLSFTLAGTETTLQSIFDQIFPGILPLGATFLCVALFNKNVKTIHIILGIFVLCILGCMIGIF